MTIDVRDLGLMDYASAYALQCAAVDEVLAARTAREAPPAGPTAGPAAGPSAQSTASPGAAKAADLVGIVLLVEHPPVITVSRRPTAAGNVVASAELLRRQGVAVVETDRGGDVTYHGPGQLVVYPILDLNALSLRLHEYMRLLEDVVIKTVSAFGIHAGRDVCATGVWVGVENHPVADPSCAIPKSGSKLCAMGVRIRRWVSMHGLALNVTVNLDQFGLIVPCGLVGRSVTSMELELAELCPGMNAVKRELTENLRRAIEARAQGVRSSAANVSP